MVLDRKTPTILITWPQSTLLLWPSPWSTQGLMGSGGDQVSMLERGGNSPSCHQTTDMSHICQQVGIQLHTQLKHTVAMFSFPFLVWSLLYDFFFVLFFFFTTTCTTTALENNIMDVWMDIWIVPDIPSSCECSQWGERRHWFLQLWVWVWRVGLSSPAGHNLSDLFWAEMIQEDRDGRATEKFTRAFILTSFIQPNYYSHPAYKALIQSRWRWLRFSWHLSCSHG